MNQQDNNIKSTKETESDSTLPFLDLITRNDDGHLSTSVYRKPTFTVLYLRWDIFVLKEYKICLVKCLIHMAWHMCSCLKGFYKEVDYVKSILVNNGYLQNFIQTSVRKFVPLKSSLDVKQTVLSPEKKEI